MTKYWIAVASKEHVMRGVKGGFAQVCHGKQGPLKLMAPGDWILYYSPVLVFGEKEPCKSFTAIGRIGKNKPYQYQMSEDFIPWRIDVTFLKAKDVPIEPLLSDLSFIRDKRRWGFPFRRGYFSIPLDDFECIASKMGVNILD